jgi:dTDP-4-amino-4,6-dideoxygalactose transaminase
MQVRLSPIWAEIAARAKSLRNYDAVKRYEHPETGLNSRLHEVQAAILSARLDWLPRFNARRREIARKYLNDINNPRVELLLRPIAEENHAYHLFVVRCAERNRLANFLKEAGIQTLIHYPIAAHRQQCCKDISYDPLGLPNAESHAERCLSLPCHPQLRDDEVSKIMTAVNKFA